MMFDIITYALMGAGALSGIGLAAAYVFLLLAVVSRGLGLMSDEDMKFLEENM